MTFLPTGPLTIASAVVIWLLSLWMLARGDRAQRHIAVALLISWFGARLSTVTEMQVIGALSWTAAALVSYRGGTVAARAIAALYAARLAFLAMVGLALTWYTFWELNRVILWLQIALAAGTLWRDGSLAVADRWKSSRRRGDHSGSVLARRGNLRGGVDVDP